MASADRLVDDGRYECDVLSAYSDLVTAYSQALISFPDYHEDRRTTLVELKRRLAKLEDQHGSTGAGRSALPLPRIYWIRGAQPSDGSKLNDVVWLHAPPLGHRAAYPMVLDLLEEARHYHPDTQLVETLCSAVAPSWEQLQRFGITSAVSHPRWDDIHGGHGDNVFERYLLCAAALTIASLGPGFGVYLPDFDAADHISTEFLSRLLREASHTGLAILVQSARDLLSDSRLAALEHAAHLESVDAQTVTDTPAWEPALSRRRPFDEGDPSGWGYIRRARHVIESGSPSRILAQHTALVHGLHGIGRDYLLEQYRALCAPPVLDTLTDSDRTNVLMGAGRLVAMARHTGESDPISLFEQAHVSSQQPLTAYIAYSIANTHAAAREPERLALAEAIYTRALADLDEIPGVDDRLYSEIRFRNGLALVRYVQHRDREAYQLEEQCLDLARQAQNQFPSILEWAEDILNANTARLLERRFHDQEQAIRILTAMLAHGGPGVQEHARIELSRIRFDEGHYEDVIELLDPAYGNVSRHWFDEPRELLARMLFAFSCVATGDTARGLRHRSRIAYLCHSLGTPGTMAFLDALGSSSNACAAPG